MIILFPVLSKTCVDRMWINSDWAEPVNSKTSLLNRRMYLGVCYYKFDIYKFLYKIRVLV